MIFSIVTVDDALGISRDGFTPWKSPANDRWIANLSAHAAVVMGRRKYQQIMRQPADLTKPCYPLFKDCMSIVLSRNPLFEAPGASVAHSWEWVRSTVERLLPTQRMYILGGASLYRQTIQDVQGIFMTHIKGDYKCDTKFPYTVDELRLLGFIESRGIKMGSRFLLEFPKLCAATSTDPERTIRLFYRKEIGDQMQASPLQVEIQGS